MFNLGNVKFGLRDLDLIWGKIFTTVLKNQGLSHGTIASDDSTNTIGPKSHVFYLKDVFHPK
jgi:hypothetical protein